MGELLGIFNDSTLGRVSLIIETRVDYILCHFYIILHSTFLKGFFSDEISYRSILSKLHFGVDHLHSVIGHNIRVLLSHMLKCYISYKNSLTLLEIWSMDFCQNFLKNIILNIKNKKIHRNLIAS